MDYRRISHLARAVLTNKATKLNIAVTSRCVYRCKSCRIWDKDDKRELTLKELEELFKGFDDVIWISLTGGEPFLRDDITQIVKCALSRWKTLHTISIPTSGFSPVRIREKIKEILQLDIPSLYVSVSLDGPESLHNELRGSRDAFRNSIDTFSILREISDPRLKVHFEHTISAFNQGSLEETIDASGYKASDFIVTFAMNAPVYNNMRLEVTPDPVVLKDETKWFLSKLKGFALHDFIMRSFLRCVLDGKAIPCCAGRNSFFIDCNGIVAPCMFRAERISDAHCTCFSPCESYFSMLMNIRQLKFPCFL